ncbi:hypothetical protein [Nitrospira sp. KM1]|uniref:hypothetical protein n=1 Tax=Nitrospira sp. KM1 TaxID=1936990 RepID=UPI00351A631D
MGGPRARLLVKLGHQFSIANSKRPESTNALAAEIGATSVQQSTPPKPETSSSSQSLPKPPPSFRGRVC